MPDRLEFGFDSGLNFVRRSCEKLSCNRGESGLPRFLAAINPLRTPLVGHGLLSAGAGGSPPTCAINSPTAGATVGGLVLMDFDALDNGTSVQVDFAFDAGSGFGVMTAAGSSPGGQSLCSTFPRPR